jgi:hypothetical protein
MLAVFGNQSDGKSSMIRGLTGLCISPVGDNRTTFGPVEISTSPSDSYSATVTFNDVTTRVNDPRGIPAVLTKKWGEQLTPRLLHVDVKDNSLPALTFVDLPGLLDDKDPDHGTISQMTLSYITRDDVFPVAVVACDRGKDFVNLMAYMKDNVANQDNLEVVLTRVDLGGGLDRALRWVANNAFNTPNKIFIVCSDHNKVDGVKAELDRMLLVDPALAEAVRGKYLFGFKPLLERLQYITKKYVDPYNKARRSAKLVELSKLTASNLAEVLPALVHEVIIPRLDRPIEEQIGKVSQVVEATRVDFVAKILARAKERSYPKRIIDETLELLKQQDRRTVTSGYDMKAVDRELHQKYVVPFLVKFKTEVSKVSRALEAQPYESVLCVNDFGMLAESVRADALKEVQDIIHNEIVNAVLKVERGLKAWIDKNTMESWRFDGCTQLYSRSLPRWPMSRWRKYSDAEHNAICTLQRLDVRALDLAFVTAVVTMVEVGDVMKNELRLKLTTALSRWSVRLNGPWQRSYQEKVQQDVLRIQAEINRISEMIDR